MHLVQALNSIKFTIFYIFLYLYLGVYIVDQQANCDFDECILDDIFKFTVRSRTSHVASIMWFFGLDLLMQWIQTEIIILDVKISNCIFQCVSH